ncbi:sensor histidine kinase [Haloarcula amylovorans]|uniref:sensor histidine kinase n=1 Tax=Haloarcula amylovorans TaxID=2562280 RepID=UPI0010760DD0|nr:PAS domain-containing sensor histidine kinase [Halomicroarcula amylolytica]
MGGNDVKSVLVVAEETSEGGTLEAALPDSSVAVTVLTDVTRVFDELTNSVVHCLVLPATIGDQSGVDIAHGVTALFPDLPVVVAGVDPKTVPDEVDILAVDSSTLDDRAVVAAVRGCLDGQAPSVAGRPPSPMETLLLSLFNELPDHLYAKDADARHVLMGRGFNEPTDRLGLTDPEVEELADEHARAAYRDEMDVIEAEQERIEVEEFLDLDAEYVRTCKVPWYDADGEIRGLVGHTQDITERKSREHAFRRQHERMVKVALVAAHEFRNELQIVQGRLELLEEEEEGEGEVGAQRQSMEDSLSRLSSLVDTVVRLSTREDEQLEPKPVWLSRLAREIWDTFADGPGTLEIERDARLVADQESASLLLQFLFQNAIEHAGPNVTVTVGTTPNGFFVADDGAGIDADPPEHVFDAGYTTIEGKTGFGLYIAQMVADEQGWHLSLSDSPEYGTRFDVENVALDG